MIKIKIKILFLLFSYVSIFILIPSASGDDMDGGITVFPSRLYIDMPQDFPNDEIQYFIKVYNKYVYSYNITTEILNPWDEENMVEGYSFIPDLSWVEIIPNETNIQANSTKKLLVTISIPDEKKSMYYNKSWEAWVKISRIGDGIHGGNTIAGSIITRLLISTPVEKSGIQMSPVSIMLTGIIAIFTLALSIYYYHFHKKKKNVLGTKAAVYYIKNKETAKDNKDK